MMMTMMMMTMNSTMTMASMSRSTQTEMLMLTLRLCIRLRAHAHLHMRNTRMTRSIRLMVRQKKYPRKLCLACGPLNATRLPGCSPSYACTARNCCKIRWTSGLDWLGRAVSRRVPPHGGLAAAAAAAGDAGGNLHLFLFHYYSHQILECMVYFRGTVVLYNVRTYRNRDDRG